jgi:hypothetical protein
MVQQASDLRGGLVASQDAGGQDCVSATMEALAALHPDTAAVVPPDSLEGIEETRAFLLGQRSALQYAFTSALPTRSAIGALQAEVRLTRALTSDTAENVHSLSLAQALTTQRLASFETFEQRVECLQLEVAQCVGAVQALNAVVSRAASESHSSTGSDPRARSRLTRLAMALLWSGPGNETFVLTRVARTVVGSGESSSFPVAGPLLLVIGTETLYQVLHRLRGSSSIPGALRSALGPVHRGSRMARTIVWSSAMWLAALEAQRVAHETAVKLTRVRASNSSTASEAAPPTEEGEAASDEMIAHDVC